MSNIEHIIERYETTIQTLTEQVQAQQQQIHELKSLLLYTMEQQQQHRDDTSTPHTTQTASEVVRVVPTNKAGKRVSALEVEPNSDDEDNGSAKKLYVYNSEEHELHWKSLVDGMVKEALYAHLNRLDEQLACSMADRLRRVTREHVVSSVDKELRRLRREDALDRGQPTIEGVTDDSGRAEDYGHRVNTSSPYQPPSTPHKNGINISRHSQPAQYESRRTSSVQPQASLMNQSRTLVDDIRRLKSMLGGSGAASLNTSTASANINNSTDAVTNRSAAQNGGGERESTSASELTARLLSKLKSKDRLAEMHSEHEPPADANISNESRHHQITPADTTDPHHRPKSAKRRHRGDDNVSPVTSPQHNNGNRNMVDPQNLVLQDDGHRPSTTVFYRKPQQSSYNPHQQEHSISSQHHGGVVQTGMEWSHLEEDGPRPSAMVDMSRHNHRY